jgi:hypothetical protein
MLFVERSSTIECYRPSPPPNLETIASKQACFIKQANTFKKRNDTGYHLARALQSPLAYLYHIEQVCFIRPTQRAGNNNLDCFIKQSNILI